MRGVLVRWSFLSLFLCLAAPPSARAAEPSPQPAKIRAGDHAGFGRLVFDLPPGARCDVSRDGRRVTLACATPLAIVGPTALPRNVRAVAGGAGRAEIELAENAVMRTTRLGDRLVIDALDPPRHAPEAQPVPAAHPARRAPASSAMRSATAADPERPPAVVQAPVAQPAASVAAPASAPPAFVPPVTAAPLPPPPAVPDVAPPVGRSAGADAPADTEPPPSAVDPLASMATLAPAADGPAADAPAFDIPAAADTGAAAFRRGELGVVVLDAPRPLDLSALRGDPVLGTAAARVLPGALLLTLRLPPERALRVARLPGGWRVSVTPVQPGADAPAPGNAAPIAAPIAATVADRRITLPAASPGRSVTIADPATGGALLVGTLRAAASPDPGGAIPVARRMPGLALLPTWRGVAVEPLSDDLVLRPGADGFALEAAGGLALAPAPAPIAALQDAAAMTRAFDIPAGPPDALFARMRAETGAAAAAPALSRARARVEAAQTMVALGLGAEAGSVLRLARADDPHLADDPRATQLAAVAALLAGRPEDAGALDAGAPGTDELTFWRAVRSAMLAEGDPGAAAGFAATLPLLRAYPDLLRARLTPLAAETMAAGGQPAAAASLLADQPDHPALALARGMLAQARGETDAALRHYDALAASTDARARVRAGVRAAGLRLAAGRIAAPAAADAMEKLLPEIAGEPASTALRLRIADVRAGAGAWRPALAVLRAGERERPDDAPVLHAALARIFGDMVNIAGTAANGAGLPPFEFVALLDENADLVPSGPAGDALAATLADRLVALDLSARAQPLLDRLMRAAATDAARAGFGLRLASLRLGGGDAAGALAALAASASDALPPPLAAARTIAMARATAAAGNPAAALAALDADLGDAGQAARADVLEQAHDWAGAARVLAARAVPATGALDEASQHLLLRLATAQARAGDAAGLAATRARAGGRIAGATGDLFRLLTAAPVRGVADLPRARAEADEAARAPGGLQAMTRVAHAP